MWLETRVGHDPWQVPWAQIFVPSPLGGGIPYILKIACGKGSPGVGAGLDSGQSRRACLIEPGSGVQPLSLGPWKERKNQPVAWVTPPVLYPQPPSREHGGAGPEGVPGTCLSKDKCDSFTVTSHGTWSPHEPGTPSLGPFQLA